METNISINTIAVSADILIASPKAPEESAKPVSLNERIKTIDVIRGIALCGILLMNIPVFGIHWSSYFTILKGPQTTTDFYTLSTIFIFFDGTMRGLFSMLFGAGGLPVIYGAF